MHNPKTPVTNVMMVDRKNMPLSASLYQRLTAIAAAMNMDSSTSNAPIVRKTILVLKVRVI
jgi:hypothetical protein